MYPLPLVAIAAAWFMTIKTAQWNIADKRKGCRGRDVVIGWGISTLFFASGVALTILTALIRGML
jgi:hypothetical protein